MFCNSPRMDEGDIARLEPTTIAGMTSLKVLFVLDHDCGQYRWFGWAHHCQIPAALPLPIHHPVLFEKAFHHQYMSNCRSTTFVMRQTMTDVL